jgi:hypothetical protein
MERCQQLAAQRCRQTPVVLLLCYPTTPVDRPAPAATALIADRFRCRAARSRPLKISCSGYVAHRPM